MKLITLQPDNSFLLDGNDISMDEIYAYKFRIHRPDGDIEIYDRREDMPVPVQAFDLDGYKQQVNEAHTQLYNNLWLSLGYMSEAEITTWSNTLKKDALSVAWKAEAKAVLSWFCETTIIVYKYLDDVTEQTAQPVETFLQTLPAFQV